MQMSAAPLLGRCLPLRGSTSSAAAFACLHFCACARDSQKQKSPRAAIAGHPLRVVVSRLQRLPRFASPPFSSNVVADRPFFVSLCRASKVLAAHPLCV